MRALIVTGTPGTGKTTVAKECAKRFGLKYLDVNKVIKEQGLAERYDKRRACNVVDTDRLNQVLVEQIEKSKKRIIIDSHLSHYLPKESVRLCIVTKCSIIELKKRLEKRGYTKSKIRENLDAEIFDVCLVEAEEMGHDIIILDTVQRVDYNKLKERFK